MIYCKHNESFIKQGQDAPLSNSNFLLEIRIPGNLDGDFASHSLELVSINRFLMAYYFRRRSFSSISAEQSCRKGEYYFVKRERHQKAGKRTNCIMLRLTDSELAIVSEQANQLKQPLTVYVRENILYSASPEKLLFILI